MPPPTETTRKYTLVYSEAPVISKWFRAEPWCICLDHGEDHHLVALNLAHLDATHVPMDHPRLGMKWLPALHNQTMAKPKDCFPTEWRKKGFALAGTELLCPDGDLHVMTFVFRNDEWGFNYCPVGELGARGIPTLVFNPFHGKTVATRRGETREHAHMT